MVSKGWLQSYGQQRPGGADSSKDSLVTSTNRQRLVRVTRACLGRIVEPALRISSATCNSILPARCGLCLLPDSGGYCSACQTLLPWIHCACQFCATPLAAPGICGKCQKRADQGGMHTRCYVPYDHIAVPFRYQSPISNHIQQLKYHRQLAMVPLLAKMLALNVLSQPTDLPEVLIPVPLHRRRLRQRGFNQAALLADAVGDLLQIPVDHRLLIRQRETPSQTDLDEITRANNMRNAFAVVGKRRYDALAVIDDVITSGATVGSACRTLKRHHPGSISVWAIAKT